MRRDDDSSGGDAGGRDGGDCDVCGDDEADGVQADSLTWQWPCQLTALEDEEEEDGDDDDGTEVAGSSRLGMVGWDDSGGGGGDVANGTRRGCAAFGTSRTLNEISRQQRSGTATIPPPWLVSSSTSRPTKELLHIAVGLQADHPLEARGGRAGRRRTRGTNPELDAANLARVPSQVATRALLESKVAGVRDEAR
ncbi:unnamed protein product [Lampetra fluviatilis]